MKVGDVKRGGARDDWHKEGTVPLFVEPTNSSEPERDHAQSRKPSTNSYGRKPRRISSDRSTVHRLAAVEGVRAYLAFWVLICHDLWSAGYQAGNLLGLPKLLREGHYAVDVFVILSGFVIFLLLDERRESYKEFIVRRFFRLFPCFAVLFVVAIPLSKVTLWNLGHAGQYLSPAGISLMAGRVHSWWQNLQWHVPMHLVMLHGAVPQAVLDESPGAFLDAAWNISLEWQFYLVAPLAFALVISRSSFRRLGVCALCVIVYVAASFGFPSVDYGAALPLHLEFFFIGAASYFLYRLRSANRFSNTWFPLSFCLAIFILVLGGKSGPNLIPLILWIIFLGLLLEDPASLSSRLMAPLFTNRVAQYLGRISYSIYLSHMLVIIVVQHALLRWAPELNRLTHFWVLLAGTVTATIAASAVLHRWVEVPGINAGRKLAKRLGGYSRPISVVAEANASRA